MPKKIGLSIIDSPSSSNPEIQESKGRGETGGSTYGDVSLLRFQKQ
ncbi:hypothetical protein SAMN05216353_11529 [Halobacillus alkaliphilus]|uniref:Uncharacterized protein n=1 Tax=Halobacillus alkaliphilus TaxID=396056 RepID=A0A1I2MT12_9BACI|nr:hypothetical protein SAMN05216353_11529 [Halobacillus alkaliphilus]